MAKALITCSTTLVALLLCAAPVAAHGPQIQITGNTGRIVTREIVLEGPYSAVLSDPKSVYVIPVLPYNGVYYARPNNTPDPLDPGLPLYYSGPGFAYGYDQITGGPQVFIAGSQLSVGFTTGLSHWNGSAFSDAGLAELEAFTSALAVKTTDSAQSATIPFPNGGIAVNYGTGGAEVHSTVRYRFLGDGVNPMVAPQDGVYLATLQLSSTDSAMQSSAPYHFVLHKNASSSEIQMAVASLGVDPSLVQYVPEAGLAALVAPLMLLPGFRRRLLPSVAPALCPAEPRSK